MAKEPKPPMVLIQAKVPQDIYRRAKANAALAGIRLKEFIASAIEAALARAPK